jgi:hypothetical protein
MGHNGGPALTARQWFEILGPRTETAFMPFQCGAPWTGHATDDELLPLAKLQRRIELRERALAGMRAERALIMNRCIRRMRRKNGKT